MTAPGYDSTPAYRRVINLVEGMRQSASMAKPTALTETLECGTNRHRPSEVLPDCRIPSRVARLYMGSSRLKTMLACIWVRNIVTDDGHSKYERFVKNNMRWSEFRNLADHSKSWNERFPEPEDGKVRIKVQACGICHGDSVTKLGLFPDIKYPRVPGHEIAGVIDEVGNDVAEWKIGQRVGVGWVTCSLWLL